MSIDKWMVLGLADWVFGGGLGVVGTLRLSGGAGDGVLGGGDHLACGDDGSTGCGADGKAV